MRIRTGFLSAALLTLIVFVPARAGADTISITSGFLDWPGSGAATLSLTGPNGFTFATNLSPVAGVFTPATFCGEPACTPGTPVSLYAHWTGNDATGTATYAGNTYTHVGAPSSLADMSLTFNGSFMVPTGSGAVSTSAPFTFSGLFIYPLSSSTTDSVHLGGAGTATISLAPFGAAFPNAFHVTHVRYDFGTGSSVPTPEPASMLLLGTGLVGTVVARRRRGK